MPSSMMPTMDLAVMRARVLKLLAKMPEMAGEMGKGSFQMALLSRALPGLLPMVAKTIGAMPDERLASFISFINNTLAAMGNPQISDQQFDAFLEGKLIDGSATQPADTTSQDAAQVR